MCVVVVMRKESLKRSCAVAFKRQRQAGPAGCGSVEGSLVRHDALERRKAGEEKPQPCDMFWCGMSLEAALWKRLCELDQAAEGCFSPCAGKLQRL